MAEFSFGQVEATLAAINDIADHKRVAFAGRLKFLQKNKLPPRDLPGRGRAGTFSFSQLMQLAAGVELLKFGMTPQRSAELINRNWGGLVHTIYESTFTDGELRAMADQNNMEEPTSAWLWLVRSDALADLTTSGVHEFDTFEAIYTVGIESLGTLLDDLGRYGHNIGEGRRTMLINGTALTREIVNQIAFHHRFSTIEALREELLEVFRENDRRLEKFLGLLEEGAGKKGDGQFQLVATLKGEEFAKAGFDKMDTDYSTNPPTPGSQVRAQATAALHRLSRKAVEVLVHVRPEGGEASVIISEETRTPLLELINLGLLLARPEDPRATVTGGEGTLYLTPLGEVAARIAFQNRGGERVEDSSEAPRKGPSLFERMADRLSVNEQEPANQNGLLKGPKVKKHGNS